MTLSFLIFRNIRYDRLFICCFVVHNLDLRASLDLQLCYHEIAAIIFVLQPHLFLIFLVPG